ncbi:MAG TPA: phosphopantetheine-binding protein [Alphaproteobacteria bacterium]|nr:phosphopantetheine-binding protein [Alphaproteobacteria bacterium]
MDMKAETSARAKLRNYLGERLRLAGESGAFADSESLFTSGRLDSLNTVQLVLFLESEFGIDFGTLGFDVSQIDSIDAIMALLDEQAAR